MVRDESNGFDLGLFRGLEDQQRNVQRSVGAGEPDPSEESGLSNSSSRREGRAGAARKEIRSYGAEVGEGDGRTTGEARRYQLRITEWVLNRVKPEIPTASPDQRSFLCQNGGSHKNFQISPNTDHSWGKGDPAGSTGPRPPFKGTFKG